MPNIADNLHAILTDIFRLGDRLRACKAQADASTRLHALELSRPSVATLPDLICPRCGSECEREDVPVEVKAEHQWAAGCCGLNPAYDPCRYSDAYERTCPKCKQASDAEDWPEVER